MGAQVASDEGVIKDGAFPGHRLRQDGGHGGQVRGHPGAGRPKPPVAVVRVSGGRPDGFIHGPFAKEGRFGVAPDTNSAHHGRANNAPLDLDLV